MKEWLTIIELAEKTNIPDTTVRRYISKFPNFFTYKGGTRSKRYEDTAIKILIRIKALFDNGYETEQVDASLRNEFPMVVDGDNKEEQAENNNLSLATADDIAEIKLALKEQGEALIKQTEFNKLLVEKLEHQERFIKESLEKRDQILMESIRTMQEEKRLLLEMATTIEQEQKKKGFFKRLFGGGK